MALHTMSRSAGHDSSRGQAAHIPPPIQLKSAASPAYDLSTGQAGPNADVQKLQR